MGLALLSQIYRAASWSAGPFLKTLTRRRLAYLKEHPTRFRERFGEPGLERPDGLLVWCHCASVGEAVSVLPLIEILLSRRNTWQVLITTGTVTSAELIAGRRVPGLHHQFVPMDAPQFVHRFLDHWRPDAAMWVESELWPNLILETARRNIPMALVNARMSAKSARNWRFASSFARNLLNSFGLVAAQTGAAAERFASLGVTNVIELGDLKLAAAPLAADQTVLQQLQSAVGDRPVWLAASIHAEEIATVAEAQRQLSTKYSGLLTVIVPRHPERGAEWADQVFSGQNVGLRSRGDDCDGDVYIADTIGELGVFYRLCPVSFIGGSLSPIGGHNPLEPARLGSAIVQGPHTFNFEEVTTALSRANAIRNVVDAQTLSAVVSELLDDDLARKQMADAAYDCASRNDQIVERTADALIALWRSKPECGGFDARA